MWGTEQETAKKVATFYTSGLPYRAPPVPGAQAGVQVLLRMGFRLAIVTSRESHEMEATRRWLDEHFEGTLRLPWRACIDAYV
jgi:phosphoglycolate phosphatase-like HAD superfamily hydrolase